MPSQKDIPMRVGFAGLGAMGFGMVLNLFQAGYDILGFDVFEVARDRFAAIGGTVAASVAESCKERDIYFSMVATPQQLDSLWFGDDGLSQNLPQGVIFCSCSTLPPSCLANFSDKLANVGRSDVRVMECPVSGGVAGAMKGKLSMMIAGEEETYATLLPVLSPISAPSRLFYCGCDLGAANILKMINQHLAGTHIVAAAEILSFAKALGLSTRQAYDIAMAGVASSWILGDRGTHMLNADWSPKSAIDIFVKDLSIVLECARDVAFDCPIADAAYSVFVDASARGDGRKDDSAVVCLYEEQMGVVVTESDTPTSSATPSRSVSRSPAGSLASGHGTSESLDIGSIAAAWQKLMTDAAALSKKGYLEQPLSALTAQNLVAITGLNDPSQAEEAVANYGSDFRAKTFIDCQLLPGLDDCATAQILLGGLDSALYAKINATQPDNLEVRAISGGIGAATSMFLTARLGSLIHLAAAAECCRLAEANGLSTDLVYRLISSAAGESYQFNRHFPAMARRLLEISSESTLPRLDSFEQALGDLKTLESVVTRLKFPARLFKVTQKVFEKAAAKVGGAETSVASVVQAWE